MMAIVREINSNKLLETFDLVASSLAPSIYHVNLNQNRNPSNSVSTENITPYAGAAEIFPYVNGKFTMGILKSSLLSQSFVLNWSSLSITRCRSRYESELAVSVVFFISSISQRSVVDTVEITAYNVASRIMYEWRTSTGANRRLTLRVVNVEILQHMFVVENLGCNRCRIDNTIGTD